MECALKVLYLTLIIAFVGIYNISGVNNFKSSNTAGTNLIVSVAGNRAEIPCVSKPRKAGDRPNLILWYKESFRKPIYSYDARSSTLSDGERWANETLFGDRAYFVPLSKPHALLVIEPVVASDEGQYLCRLDYEDSPTTSSTVNLTVVVYPTPPEIYWNNQQVTGPIGPMHEGTHSRLVCVTRGGRPPPSITWWQEGGHQVRAEIQSTERDETKAILTSIASRELSMNTFSCHAQVLHEGAPVGEPLVASVIFRIVLAPIAISISGGSEPVAVDTTLTLRCTAWGSYPPAEVVWWKSGKKFKPSVQSMSEGGNSSTSEIKLTVQESDHGLMFTCRATNPKYSVPSMEESVTLNVTYKPSVTLRVKVASEFLSKNAEGASTPKRSVTVKQGADVVLECPVHANPPPNYIEWTHNGITIESGKTAFSLLLEKSKKETAGTYTCAATNEGGVGVSQPFVINVEYPPVCAKGWQKRTHGSETNRSVTVLCRVEALPDDDLTFSWSKIDHGNKEVSFDPNQIQTDGATSRLTIIPMNWADYGQFLCRAKNSAGVQLEPCQVTLVPSSRPDPPFNCSTDSAGFSGSLVVSCLEGFNGGLPQKFSLTGRQRGKLVANITRDFSEWILSNLETGKSVTLRIESFNAKGSSETVRLEVFVPVPSIMADQDDNQLVEGGQRSPRIEIPLIGMLVGGGGVLVISLVVLVIYSITSRRRRAPKHLHNRHRKYHSAKIINSEDSNCTPPNNGYDIVPQNPQNKVYDLLPPNNGYDVIPLNRLKKVSDPDVVICIKSGNVSRRSSNKGLDIIPVQSSQMEPLVNSTGPEAFERTSDCSYHDEDCCNVSTCGNEEHSNEIDNSAQKTKEKQDIQSRNNSRNNSKQPCWDGEYSEVSFYSKSVDQYKTYDPDSRPHSTVSEDIYALARSKIQQNRCSECNNCSEYAQTRVILHQNRKNSITSLDPGCQEPQQVKTSRDKLKNIQNERHCGHNNGKNEEFRAMIIDPTDHISNNEEDDDDVYEDTSHYSNTIVTIEPRENDSPSTERKPKIWRSNLGGLLCSKSKSDSIENVKNLQKHGGTSHPDKSSTYQKFDGVYSYEFPLPDPAGQLQSSSPPEGSPRSKPKKAKGSSLKPVPFKGEYEDLLYISKAELDNLLNIEDNKKEQKILAGVSPLKDLLQHRENEKNNKRKNSKVHTFSEGNMTTDLKTRLRNDKQNNRLKREGRLRSKEPQLESLEEHKIVTPNGLGIMQIPHKNRPIDVRILTPKISNKIKKEKKSAAFGDLKRQISEPTISEFERGSTTKSFAPLSESQPESSRQSDHRKSRSTLSNSAKYGGSTESSSKPGSSKTIRIDPNIPSSVKTLKRQKGSPNPGGPSSSITGDRRKYKSEGNSPSISPSASKSILNVRYREKAESNNPLGRPYLSRSVALSTPEFEMDVQEGKKLPLRSILRHN